MGNTLFKVSHPCDCQSNYGDCDKHNAFLFSYNRACDVGSLAYIKHADAPDPSCEFIGHFDDKAIEALVKVLSQKDSTEDWTVEDSFAFENSKRIKNEI